MSTAPATPDAVILPAAMLPPEVNIHALIDYRREQVQRRQYKPLGIVEKICFEKSAVADVGAENPLTHGKTFRNVAALDWYKTGPLCGVSLDEKQPDVLICSAMAHPPEIPDPDWVQPYPPKGMDANGFPILEKPPRIAQRLRDYSSGVLPAKSNRTWSPFLWFAGRSVNSESDFWFVIQPVLQVLIILADRAGLGMIECSADPRGRHTAFLYNAQRQEGHLLFGSMRVELYH